MGITRDNRTKRRATGGKKKHYRKSRQQHLGHTPTFTKTGDRKVTVVRTRGGATKMRAIRLDAGNFAWATEAVARKTRIMRVVYSAVSNELVRTNTLVKGQIIEIDAAPFRLWYEQHYGVQLSKKGKEAAAGKPAAPTAAGAPAPAKKETTSKKGAAKKAAGKAAAKPAAGKGAAAKKDAPAKKEGEKKEGKEKKEKKEKKETTAAATLAAKKLLGLSLRKRTNLLFKQKRNERKAKQAAENKDKPKSTKTGSAPNPNKKPRLDKEGKPKPTRTHSLKRQGAARAGRVAPLDPHLAEQFLQGRLFACIVSRPGQDGCADGYILEGKELEFYTRKMQKKKAAAK